MKEMNSSNPTGTGPRFARLTSQVLLVALAIVHSSAALASPKPIKPEEEVYFEPIPEEQEFAEATAPSALQYACSTKLAVLKDFFRQKGLPFDAELVRWDKNRKCHIYYEPTIPGYRALPDNAPISELYIDVAALSFLGQRTALIGDTLDMAKTILPHLPPQVEITLGVNGQHDKKWYGESIKFHFGEPKQALHMRDKPVDVNHSFAQDYLKAGTVNGAQKILVTQLLFQGRGEDGRIFKPLLNTLSEERFVRSKLSWEGGDLQFGQHPNHRDKLVMFYGDAAKDYWGAHLTDTEYRYILKLEFGADEAMNLSGFVPHVDYLICLLPADKTILLSEPMRKNYAFTRAAMDRLLEIFPQNAPPEVRKLDALLSDRKDVFDSKLPELRETVARAKAVYDRWPLPEDPVLTADLDNYVSKNCPGNASECFSPAGRAKLVEENLPLMKAWVTAAMELNSVTDMVPRMLSIIESQFPKPPSAERDVLFELAMQLESMGYRVVRVPRIEGDQTLPVPWAGIAYVNSTLVDDKLFVPSLGLGAAEEAVFDKLRKQLPGRYQVIPVYSRYAILRNGGIHCSMGIIRQPGVETGLRQTARAPK